MGYLLRLARSKLRALKNVVTRPYAVTKAQRLHVKMNPYCRACGGSRHCQAHHIKPYHKYPKYAAQASNFITLCMSREECHLRIGHGGDFHWVNPCVVEDAAAYNTANPVARSVIIFRARFGRVPDR